VSTFDQSAADINLPLISCLMPTYNRRAFVLQAIRYFFRQDYPNKELIVIDDGEDSVEDLMPADERVRYFRMDKKHTLGDKLNMGCEYARGPLIAHWDDDDWYAPRRLRYQAETLHTTKTSLCGINRLLYYDLCKQKALEYIYPAEQRVWLIGSSLFYRKALWNTRRFADINVGMDGLFVWAAPEREVTVLSDHTYAVHMIHEDNVSPKKTEGRWWHPYATADIKTIVAEDWKFYSDNALRGPWRNIYACLVHEREDCILDLVRNLHHHDPDSVILLYNGGGNTALLSKDFPLEKYGVVAHPNPSPIKWGYLHQFALDCMRYATERLEFDSLTIVDSDQLCLRSDYSKHIGSFFSGASNIGMLSNMPERITRDHTKMHVAMQAFKEYDLWKPLLQSFPSGEEKFVHWTYWPSTVFTAPACADLVHIFSENTLLKEIMSRTKIWATEEVILPLLVRLLGYTISANPCAYDIVRYRKPISPEELRTGFSRPNVFWAHPVRRLYDDPIRTFIRQRMMPPKVLPTPVKHIAAMKTTAASKPPEPVQKTDPVTVIPAVASRPGERPSTIFAGLLPKLRKIGGWLSDQEANLLADHTLKACDNPGRIHHIVEIGSYHGKSTVLFASLIKSFGLRGTVHAIDIHDGQLGAADQELKKYPPSFGIFNHNLSQAGVRDVVQVIKERSFNVEWGMPVSLLFIDGLHDYANVRKDFDHFAEWLSPNGFVAFHDYADYYPGVKICVDEVLATGAYVVTGHKETLIVLQKQS
jgi:glycosyltransferase involved in cell wall biosynthesis